MKHTMHSGGPIGEAYLEIMIEEVGTDALLSLDYHFPCGEGVSLNEESSLVRPFRKILRGGKPIGNIVYVFYEEGKQYFVLGSLCKTEKRLLFFPSGYVNKLVTDADGKSVEDQNLHIDHISLEESLRAWHFTLKEKRTKGIRLKPQQTLKINEKLFLWFVLQASSLDDFERMPATQKIFLKTSKSEVIRRANIIVNSREGAVFQSVLVHGHLKTPYIVNFEFFIDLDGHVKWDEIPLYIPTPTFPITEQRKFVENRTHDISVKDLEGNVVIRVSKIPGSNKNPWILLAGINFKNAKPLTFDERSKLIKSEENR